jgi:hypothetical protein
MKAANGGRHGGTWVWCSHARTATRSTPDGWTGTFERHTRQAGLPHIRLQDPRDAHARRRASTRR